MPLTRLIVQLPAELRRRMRRAAHPRGPAGAPATLTPTDLVAAYAEFAAEERALAHVGKAHYVAMLAREEAAA